MRTVRFLEGQNTWPYVRQSPLNDGVFGDTQFYFGLGPEPTDWLALMNEVPREQAFNYPRERVLFFTGEPSSVRTFKPQFLAQFGTVVTSDRAVDHPGVVFSAPPVPWQAGIQPDDIAAYPDASLFKDFKATPVKTKLCSCVCSSMRITKGHRARLAFVDALKQEFGDQIDFFGRGFRPIPNKDEALVAYRYHIAIENTVVDDYWTEKLGDAFLQGCFPIYGGALNISKYFDPRSMVTIDVEDHAGSIARIKEVLGSNVDSARRAELDEAKRRVMWQHNLLAVIDRLAAEREGVPAGPSLQLLPEGDFKRPSLLLRIKMALAG